MKILIYLNILIFLFFKRKMFLIHGWGKSSFTVVSTRNTSLFLYYYLLVIVLFSMKTAGDLPLLHPILGKYFLKCHFSILSTYFCLCWESPGNS